MDSDTGTCLEGIRSPLFSVELQTRIFTGKRLKIHTVRVDHVLSFSCICSECESRFATQSLLELHLTTHLQTQETLTDSATSVSLAGIAGCGDEGGNITDNTHSHPDDCKTIDEHADVESSDCSETGADNASFDVKDSSTENHAILDLPDNAELPVQTTSTDISEQTGNSEMRSFITSTANKDKYSGEASGISEHDTFQLIDISQLAENANMFECNFCGKKLRRKRTFIEHMNRHADEKPHEGTVRDRRKTRKSQRKTRTKKRKGRNQPLCEVCGKQFPSKCDLKRHILVHTGEKPHSCDVCGKQFRVRFQLTEHMNVHQEEKSHVCSFCGMSFSRKEYLKRHERVHGDKTILCSVCGKSFKQWSSLFVHSRTHATDKPLFCSECGKTFCQKFYLEEHIRIHTGERPLKCPHCDLTFRMRESVRIHIKRQHKEPKQKTGTETSSVSHPQNTLNPM